MTNTARKSLNKKIILVLMAALLALALALQVVYAPAIVSAPKNSVGTASSDSMNGVSVTYTDAPNGLGTDYSLTDTSVSQTASQMATPAPSKQVQVIVSLEGTPMMNYAVDNNMTVAQAMQTAGGKKNLENLRYIRETAINELSQYIIERRYDYSTVMNAFSATIEYGNLAAIENNKRVKNVMLSQTYLAPEAVTENYVDVYETGIFNSDGVGYDGTGTVVAVVDTGTDYTHEVFDMELAADTLAINKDDVAALVSELTATSLSREQGDIIDEDDLYLTSKLPYAYDYADSDVNVYPHNAHGTHVAGIIAGKSDKITGVATGAQIATFKVFSDYSSGARSEWILAALNDAVLLGVDAINMSLGTSCGFSREVDEFAQNQVFDAVNAAGICLVVAASNDGSSAQNSTWGSTNLASNPDSGTVGSPGSYNAALSVASVSGVKTKYFVSEGEDIYFSESRLIGKIDPNDFVGGLLGDNTEGEFEYTVVPGIGASYNYRGVDVNGKIAVVKRGGINFEEKVRAAAANNAIGVIVYNNVSGTITMSVGTKMLIPSCFITMDMAKNLVARGTGKVKLSTSYLAGPFMSDFSSWGCLPNLILAPDITAHGGEIYSAIPGGDQYDKMSGTSMACPNLAGALILVREFVKEKQRKASTTAIRDESYSRMMSTATIVKNEQGNPYSPRKQGAGIADISHSINTQAYLTVDGLNKPKLSLGDDPERTGEYVLKFNLVNSSANAVSYALDQYVMTEGMSSDDRTVSEKAYLFNDTTNTYAITKKKGAAIIDGNNISLSGYGEVAITVRIKLSDADKQYLNKWFINGMFVEGYVMLKSQNSDGIDLNIPYMAFYGDWSDAPMLDVSAYEVGASAVDDSVLEEDKLVADVHGTLPYSGFYSYWADDKIGYYGMGAYAYTIASGYKTPVTQEKFAALTTNFDGDYMLYMINAGLLRCAKRVEMEIRNSATGELIWSGVDYNARKSHSSGGDQTGGMVLIELDMRTLDLPNNAKYTFNMTCYLDWKGDNEYIKDYGDQLGHMDEYKPGNKNTFSFEFTIDNEAPQIARANVRKVKRSGNNPNNVAYDYALELGLYDNHYMQGFGVYTYSDISNENGYEQLEGVTSLTDGLVPVNGDMANSEELRSIDISGYWNKIMENGGKLYVTLYDYAKNSRSYYLVITEDDVVTDEDNTISVTPKKDLVISKNRNVRDDYTIKVNEQLNIASLLTVRANINEGTGLDAMYQDGYWMENLVWKVKDESIAKITNEGILTALKEGETEVTILTPNLSEYDPTKPTQCLKFIIKVNGVQEGGVKVSGIELSATTLTLEVGETATISARVRPLDYDFKDIKLEWSDGRSFSKYIKLTVSEDTMSMTVEVLDELPSGSVSITVNYGKTTDYIQGSCTIKVLPEYTVSDNIYLRSYTGRGKDWVNEKGEIEHNVVEIPDDLGVSYIYPSAFYGNEYIKKVIIPEGITELMRATFMNCSELEEVVLPSSLETIDYLAFANCNKLKKINLGNVKSIGDSSFWGCAMEELDLSKCTYIDKYAFVFCKELKSLDLSRVGMIGGGAFAHCNGLEELILPENTSLEYDTTYLSDEYEYQIDRGGVFSYCENLKKVTVRSRNLGRNAFYCCFALETVTFENNIDEIGMYAFAGCSELKNVTFYGSVYKIGDEAFLLCESLEEITLPDGLTILGDQVFLSANNLRTVKISSGAMLDSVGAGSLCGIIVDRSSGIMGHTVSEYIVEDGNKYLSSVDGVLYDKAKTTLIAYPGAKAVPADFRFTVPASVKTIGQGAFAYVQNVPQISLSNVEYIESDAFREMQFVDRTGEYGGTPGANYFISFESYDNVKYIGETAFSSALLNNLPISQNATTYIGDGAFFGASLNQRIAANATLTIPKNLKYLGDYAFAGEYLVYKITDTDIVFDRPFSLGFTTLTFAGSSIKSVGVGAFANNPDLREVSFGNLEAISDRMFEGCYIKTLDESSFDESNLEGLELTEYGLTEISIPDTVKYIGGNAFAGNKLLTTVRLPEGLKNIADGAFRNTAITSVALPDKVESIGAGAFENSQLQSITLPDATNSIGANAFSGTPIAQINYQSGNGAVKSIGAGAFKGCANLTAAVFPHAVTVGVQAFKGATTLASVDLSVAEIIGEQAFSGCASLTTVELPKAEIIGVRAFAGASGLTQVTMPIVKAIDAEAFSGTGITKIELSKYFGTDILRVTLAKYFGTDPTALSLSDKYFTGAADKAFYGMESLDEIKVDEDNKTYKSIDGVLYSVNGNNLYTLVSYPADKDGEQFTVYNKTIKIGAYAFNGNKHIQSLTLSVYVQVIGMSAMSGMDNLTALYINAVKAPTLESYAYMVYPEKDDDDKKDPSKPEDGEGNQGDENVDDDNIEDDNEIINRNDGVFTNFYDNFNFAFEDADKNQNLTIYIPYNNSGYDARIWQKYVGKCISKQKDKLHIEQGTLGIIESMQAELEKEKPDVTEVNRLLRLFDSSVSYEQQQFIIGNYDYVIKDSKDNVIASIDAEYYQSMFGGTNFYQSLTALLQGRSANASSVANGAEYSVASVTNGDAAIAFVVAVVALCVILAVTVSAFAAKRRNRK